MFERAEFMVVAFLYPKAQIVQHPILCYNKKTSGMLLLEKNEVRHGDLYGKGIWLIGKIKNIPLKSANTKKDEKKLKKFQKTVDICFCFLYNPPYRLNGGVLEEVLNM